MSHCFAIILLKQAKVISASEEHRTAIATSHRIIKSSLRGHCKLHCSDCEERSDAATHLAANIALIMSGGYSQHYYWLNTRLAKLG